MAQCLQKFVCFSKSMTTIKIGLFTSRQKASFVKSKKKIIITRQWHHWYTRQWRWDLTNHSLVTWFSFCFWQAQNRIRVCHLSLAASGLRCYLILLQIAEHTVQKQKKNKIHAWSLQDNGSTYESNHLFVPVAHHFDRITHVYRAFFMVRLLILKKKYFFFRFLFCLFHHFFLLSIITYYDSKKFMNTCQKFFFASKAEMTWISCVVHNL